MSTEHYPNPNPNPRFSNFEHKHRIPRWPREENWKPRWKGMHFDETYEVGFGDYGSGMMENP